jgi:hypothetical protein
MRCVRLLGRVEIGEWPLVSHLWELIEGKATPPPIHRLHPTRLHIHAGRKLNEEWL